LAYTININYSVIETHKASTIAFIVPPPDAWLVNDTVIKSPAVAENVEELLCHPVTPEPQDKVIWSTPFFLIAAVQVYGFVDTYILKFPNVAEPLT
jgi:hypothetical protein